MYVFSDQFLQDLAARLVGPMSFRFIMQPLFAMILGMRDGIMDARAGMPPFIYYLIFRPRDRKTIFKSALLRLLTPMIVGTVLDAIAQYLIFGNIWPLPALIVGVFIMALPYSFSRGITNRIVSVKKNHKHGEVQVSEQS